MPSYFSFASMTWLFKNLAISSAIRRKRSLYCSLLCFSLHYKRRRSIWISIIVTKLWMTLNTADGNKKELWIYLFTYFYVCTTVPLSGFPANPLANEVCTQIGPRWLPLALFYENRIQSNNNQAWYNGIEIIIKEMRESS